MRLKIAWIGKSRDPSYQMLTQEYLKRISRYAPIEAVEFKDESAFLRAAGKPSRHPPHRLVLLDRTGRQFSSEDLAKFLRDHSERDSRPLLFAVGPADGFPAGTRQIADFTLSLGKMTLAHELARVVLLEQLYRAFTILAGHPYHRGH
jgi:23S rRNA (pseudouridine1915-N3)-methyltransferase